jgi:TetR/AcrR family transcriptional repressor of nem operon
MARPRSFDPDDVLKIARDIFWQKGFQGTSLDDITAASGVAKPSLYAAFGDKNALFLKVLDGYHDAIVRRAETALSEGASARDAIAQWLLSFVPSCSGARGVRGCLSINTVGDSASGPAEVAERSAHFIQRLEHLMRDRLRRDRVQFSSAFDPDVTAHTLATVYTGLMVMAKQAPSAARVRATLTQTLKLLD